MFTRPQSGASVLAGSPQQAAAKRRSSSGPMAAGPAPSLVPSPGPQRLRPWWHECRVRAGATRLVLVVQGLWVQGLSVQAWWSKPGGRGSGAQARGRLHVEQPKVALQSSAARVNGPAPTLQPSRAGRDCHVGPGRELSAGCFRGYAYGIWLRFIVEAINVRLSAIGGARRDSSIGS